MCALVLFTGAGADTSFVQEYQKPGDFLTSIFGDPVPPPQSLWVDEALRLSAEKILGHRFSLLRVKVWSNDTDSAYILEEIGKEAPITFGIHVRADQIQEAKVLLYRETRGFEVSRSSFSDQFRGARLEGNDRLNSRIDGISGATLSVHAMTRVVRLALVLERRWRELD